MAWADVGGDNYNHGAYNGRKDRNPWMLVGGTETASAFYARGKYSLTSFDSGIGGTRVNSPGDTGSYSSEYPTGWNFVSAPVSVREHRMDVRPFVYGEMNWTGHDYLGEPTPWSYPAKSSSFGTIDTAGFEKDSFYMYRSAWSDMPTVHILPQKWNWTAGTQIPVMIYTNGKSVELFVNDVSVGVKNYDKDTSSPIYVYFGKFAYTAGSLKAVAYSGANCTGSVIAIDEVYTAGNAQRIELSSDRAFVKNDGTDLVYIEASITDSAGVKLPDATNSVTWTVQGGEIVALDNGDPRDTARHRPSGSDNTANARAATFSRNAFSGKALAIIKPLRGSTQDIVITASAVDSGATIRSNTITVESRTEVGDGTGILDYEKPEVTTGVGITPILPDNFRVIYDNGLMGQFSVTSWNLASVNLDVVGTYTAYGTTDGFAGAIEAIVHVKEIAAIEDIYVTGIAGVYPPLPSFVTIRYTDGVIGAAPVKWDPIAASLYADINAFDVLGKLGPTLTVTAHVAIKKVVSVQDITVYTTVGKVPDMPESVSVMFNDASIATIPVEWDLAVSDYTSAGEKQIAGKLLGSSIKAKCTLIVRYVVFLSDLSSKSSSGTVVKDKTVAGNTLGARGVFGGPPTQYQKGLGTRAPAEAVYDISALGYEAFQAYVSLSMDDGGMTGRGAVSFEVYLDGALAFDSGYMDRQSEAVLVYLDLAGVSELKIVTKSLGSDGAEFDLGDWCDAKFYTSGILVSNVTQPAKQIYLNNVNQIPALPTTTTAQLSDGTMAAFTIKWPTLTSSMFSAAGVVPVYGKLEGTSNGVVLVKIITNYNSARTASDFSQKVGSWSEIEKFDWSSIAVDAKPNLSTLTFPPKLIYAQNNLLVENVQKYGFGYGVYPISAGASNTITFATPNLSYFQLLNIVANAAASATLSANFTIETSPDNTTWTTFTNWTRSGNLPGSGSDAVWPQRTVTSNGNIPAGTNFLRVTWPNISTAWHYQLSTAEFRGAAASASFDADMAFFELGAYAGTINQTTRTVTVNVPGDLDITRLTPKVYVSSGATYSPAGAVDFSSPVTYTVTNGAVSNTYTVTVNRALYVNFNLYGGNIGGDTDDIVQLVNSGGNATAPAVPPVRDGYTFVGWNTNRTATTAQTLSSVTISQNTTFYAIWSKLSTITLTAVADAGLKTWQSEKGQNFGSDSTILVRQTNNTGTNGLFGQNFTNTSTSDGTDMKTAYFKFDVSSIKGLTISSASLSLRYTGNTNSAGAGGNTNLLVARVTDSNWSESSITWNSRPRTLYGNVGSATASDVAQSAQFSAAQSTAVTTTTDVLKLYNTLPAGDNMITFAVTIALNNRDYQLMSKEGASANPSYAPRLILGIAPEPDYTVTYNLNGGTGSVPIQPTLESGMTFVVAGARGFTGPDMLFKEWNTSADGSGASYNPGDIFAVASSNVTLYAIWSDARAIIVSTETVFNKVGVVTVRAADPSITAIFFACYNDRGVLMAVSGKYPLNTSGGQEQDVITGYDFTGAALVRVFIWDDDFVPMAEAADVYKK